jgi:hypothetical protein
VPTRRDHERDHRCELGTERLAYEVVTQQQRRVAEFLGSAGRDDELLARADPFAQHSEPEGRLLIGQTRLFLARDRSHHPHHHICKALAVFGHPGRVNRRTLWSRDDENDPRSSGHCDPLLGAPRSVD